MDVGIAGEKGRQSMMPFHPSAFRGRCAMVLWLLVVGSAEVVRSADRPDEATIVRPGTVGDVGCGPNPKRVRQLRIDKPGVYENYLVDGEWSGSTLVKITADDVTLRNCEIRNGRHNAITVVAKNVVIESCRIHHLLKGTFEDQQDAHGITGRPTKLVIRNCDIGLTSGDSIQFDPGRGEWDDVRIEHCNLWTGPLPADAAGFQKGQRPGENALDTKQQTSNPRSRLTIRACLLYGWNQPGQISNMAALNLKNHVQARVVDCLFRDNEICLRIRGGQGEYGGAQVTIENCAVYDSLVGLRIESDPENLKIHRLGIGHGIQRTLRFAGRASASVDTEIAFDTPPPFEVVRKNGLARRAARGD
jgi:hypothetical protein